MTDKEEKVFDELIEEMKEISSSVDSFQKNAPEDKDTHIVEKPKWNKSLSSKTKQFFTNISKEFLGNAKKVISTTIESLSLKDRMASFASATYNAIKNTFHEGLEMATNLLLPKDKVEFILNVLFLIEGIVLSMLYWDDIKGIFNTIKDAIADTITALVPDSLKEFFTDEKGGWASFVKGVKTFYDSWIAPAVNRLKEAVHTVWDTAVGFYDTITGGDFSKYIIDPIKNFLGIDKDDSLFLSVLGFFWNLVKNFGMYSIISLLGLEDNSSEQSNTGYYTLREHVITQIRDGKGHVAAEDIRKAREESAKAFTKQMQSFLSRPDNSYVSAHGDMVVQHINRGFSIDKNTSEKITQQILNGKIDSLQLNIGSSSFGVQYTSQERYKLGNENANKIIKIVNDSLTSGKIMSYEDFTNALNEYNKTSGKDSLQQSNDMFGLYESYKKAVQVNNLYNEVEEQKNDFSKAIYDIRLANAQKRMVLNSNIDTYYGDFNTGSKGDDAMAKFARNMLSPLSIVKDTIRAITNRRYWENTPSLLLSRFMLGVREFLSNIDLGQVLTAISIQNHFASISGEQPPPAVNFITVTKPEGFNELSDACYQVQMMEDQLEEELNKQHQLIEQLSEVVTLVK